MTTLEKTKLSPDEVINQVNAAKPEEQRAKIKEVLKNYTIYDLENLAKKIKGIKGLEKKADQIEQYKKGMRERIEELSKEKGFNEGLEVLNTRNAKFELLALLPELKPKEIAKPKGMLEKGSGYAIGAFNSVIGWFKGAGGWIGGAATYAYNYLANPENRAKLVRTIGNLAKSGWYHLLKAPALVGIPPTFPGLGKIAAGADEKLKQMDAIDTIYEIVETENENPDTPPVKFDGKMNKTVWMRWKPEERTPEAIQRMTLAYIDAQRKAGNDKVVVTMSALKNPEAAAKSASETLLKTLAKDLGVSKVAFGVTTSAKKESGEWSIIIPENDVDKTSNDLVSNSNAKKLVEATKKMAAVSEIVFEDGKTDIEISKTKIVLAAEKFRDTFNAIAKAIPDGPVQKLRLNDSALPTPNHPIAKYSNRVLSFNTRADSIGIISEQENLSSLIKMVNGNTSSEINTWKYENNKWEAIPKSTT